jgi:hypothetical protein
MTDTMRHAVASMRKEMVFLDEIKAMPQSECVSILQEPRLPTMLCASNRLVRPKRQGGSALTAP